MTTRAWGSLLLILLCLVTGRLKAEVVPPDDPIKPIPAPVAPDPVPLTPPVPIVLPSAHKPNLPEVTPPKPGDLNVDEPGFKATVRIVEPPREVTAAEVTSAPKKFTRPNVWSLPLEEGVDGQPIADAGPQLGAGPAVEETISPALANVIARERSGKKAKDLVPLYQDVARAEPENAEAFYRLGLAMMRDGQSLEGTAALEQALALKPSNPKYQCDYGLALLRAGQRDKALVATQSAAVNAPAIARYQSALGDCFLAVNRPKEAAESYQRAINLEPNNPDYVYNFGLAQMTLKQFKKAIEVFDEAIRLKPSNPQYYCSRGVALENTKKPREALGCYMQALRLDKNHAQAHYLVARMYSDPEDPTYTSSLEAMEHAQKAVKLTQWKNAEYIMGLARALRVAHNFDEAVAMARKAIQVEPRDEYRKELDALEKLQTLGNFEFSK